MNRCVPVVCALALLLCGSVTPALAGDPLDWWIAKPSNTGVPGEEIRFVRFGPDGNPWVGARWPFWGEAGIGVFDLANEAWSVWSNWETPIPSPYLNDLAFDADGVAWLATNEGLVRYDGETWTVYDTSNTPMLLQKVRDIALAPNGHIWVNNSDFNGGGDAVYDFDGDSTWIKHAVPNELPWEAPWTDMAHVFVDSQGHAWVANDVLPGVAEFDGTRWTLRGESLGKCDEMAEDQFGNIWINANGVGGPYAFHRWDGQQFTTYPFYSPTTLTSDPDTGTIYVGNWGGEIVRTSDGGETIEPYLSGLNQVFSIAPDPAGTDVWVGTIGAVGHFLDDGTWVRDFNSYNSGVPWYWIDRMTTDRDGYFWIATGEAGLSRFDGERWRNWGAHNAGSEPYPFAGNEPMGNVYQDTTGTHWFGGNGIARSPASGTGRTTPTWA
jgi:ligand-binding sensor domain-containing protein